jgi:hypothetical protein
MYCKYQYWLSKTAHTYSVDIHNPAEKTLEPNLLGEITTIPGERCKGSLPAET